MPTSAAIPATSLIHHLPSSGGGSQQQPGVAVSASSLSTASKQHLFSSHHDNNSSMGHHSINSSAASIISTTHTVGSNSSGCGRSGCSGAILVMFPSSPSRPSTVGTIRANVRTGGPSFASSPTATSSSILVNGDNAGAQKFCACGGDEETAGLDRTTPAHSPNVSSSVVMDGSSYVNSSLKSGSYLGSSGLGTNGTHSNAEDCMDVETEDEPEAQLYIDTQLANLDFHTPSSHCQSQKRLSSNEGAVSHSPMSSSQFLSIRNRSNTNPHSQSIFSSSNSPVPNYFSSSFDGAKSPLSLKAMVNNNTSNSQSNHQASTYHPLSPARVPRPLGTFRRYHAHSISGNSGDERANHPNNHHRSHQNFSRTAAMNSMHNARSIDSAGNFGHAHPSNTTSVDLSRTALLIRENAFMASMDSPMSCSSLNSSMPEINKIIFESQEAVYSLFMKAHKCYDLIPTSSKLVVFDTELPVSKAFFALVYNGVRAAPLWDSKTQEFVGMLTITDFIQILHKYYAKDGVGDGMKQLEEHKISTWRNVFENDGKLKQFVTIDPSESLYRAVQILCDSKIHRLPVLESATGNILYILTHKRLIKFLFLYINDLPKPAYMEKTPKELGIGSWGEISTISKDTLLIDALKIFLQKRVSALPLLDLEGRVVDIYAKFDAINLAADKTYNNLDETVFEALKQRSDWFEGVRKCSEKDNLMTVIDILVKAEVHRLIVTDDEQRVTGIISLSDILRHLVLDPPQAQAGNENLLLNTDSGMECDDVNSQEQLAVSS